LPTTTSEGLTFTYETHGNPNDPAILLIMGLGMQLTSWPEIFCQGLVEQGFYVIRFDNRDSGLSSKLEHLGKPNVVLNQLRSMFRLPVRAGYTLYDMAKDSIAVLDAVGVKKAHVVGASMGGMIAQIVAAKYPEQVLSLTSIMSTSGRRGLPGPTLAARRAILSRPAHPNDIDQVVQHFAGVYRSIGSPAYLTPEDILRKRVAASIKRSVCPAGVLRQLAAIVASGSRAKLLQTLRTPTLVIHGTADPLVPIECGRDTARLVPGAVMREIVGMGHDFPAQLNETMVRMIGAHCKTQSVPESVAS
jgi:pimeloyl-ACP methyl ester carboxylesterase